MDTVRLIGGAAIQIIILLSVVLGLRWCWRHRINGPLAAQQKQGAVSKMILAIGPKKGNVFKQTVVAGFGAFALAIILSVVGVPKSSATIITFVVVAGVLIWKNTHAKKVGEN